MLDRDLVKVIRTDCQLPKPWHVILTSSSPSQLPPSWFILTAWFQYRALASILLPYRGHYGGSEKWMEMEYNLRKNQQWEKWCKNTQKTNWINAAYFKKNCSVCGNTSIWRNSCRGDRNQFTGVFLKLQSVWPFRATIAHTLYALKNGKANWTHGSKEISAGSNHLDQKMSEIFS